MLFRSKAKDLSELSAWLKSQNVQATAYRGVRAAEQVPMAWLPQIHKMREGEIGVFEGGERLVAIRVVTARAAPVEEAVAAPRIAQYLTTRRVSEALGAEIKRLREKSNIEYVGAFAGGPKTPAKPESEPFQPQPEKPAAPAKNFEKGIRGLR